MPGKEQVVALVDGHIVTRLDTLRLIDGTSRARVLEPMLADAVDARLAELEKEVKRVEKLAKRAGMTLERYVEAYARAYSRKTYGPGLAELEKDDSIVTGRP